jgi:hypothetical protein
MEIGNVATMVGIQHDEIFQYTAIVLLSTEMKWHFFPREFAPNSLH